MLTYWRTRCAPTAPVEAAAARHRPTGALRALCRSRKNPIETRVQVLGQPRVNRILARAWLRVIVLLAGRHRFDPGLHRGRPTARP
jgi:hypothetical protein